MKIEFGRSNNLIPKFRVLFEENLIVVLVVLQTLREYWKKEKSKKWLFLSWNKEKHITARTFQTISQNICKKAGIKKDMTVHTLKHPFAIHLSENGVDLRLFRNLLGHKSSKTTEIYTHVSKANIASIKSPLDTIWSNKHDVSVSRRIYICNTAYIILRLEDIRIADINELAEILPFARGGKGGV